LTAPVAPFCCSPSSFSSKGIWNPEEEKEEEEVVVEEEEEEEEERIDLVDSNENISS
jgi:hypothetical protein